MSSEGIEDSLLKGGFTFFHYYNNREAGLNSSSFSNKFKPNSNDMADITSKAPETAIKTPLDSETNKDRLELTDIVSVDKDPNEDFELMEALGK